jgi:hypothetical protein
MPRTVSLSEPIFNMMVNKRIPFDLVRVAPLPFRFSLFNLPKLFSVVLRGF